MDVDSVRLQQALQQAYATGYGEGLGKYPSTEIATAQALMYQTLAGTRPMDVNESPPEPTEWRLDPVGAARYAQVTARPLSLPPHWVRCEYMRGGIRCKKGDGHPGEHEEPK